MVQRGAGPEDALLAVDPLVGDAVVVGDAAAGREPQLFENLAGLAEVEELAAAQAAREVADDIRIGARIAGRVDRFLNVDDARLHVGRDALLFLLQAAGQHDVGMLAVSERKKSMTPRNSRRSSASRVKLASGSETRGLKQIESKPLISPRGWRS